MRTSPPLELSELPASNSTLPPSPDCEIDLPAVIETSPPRPTKLLPTDITNDPEAPEIVDPVEIPIPNEPIIIDPVDADIDNAPPLSTVIDPPVPVSLF